MSADKRLALLAHANKFFRQGKIDSAIKQYEKILEIRPEDIEIRRIIGDLQLKENREAEAVRQFEWIADYYLKEGFFTKAIAMYKRISRISSDNEGIYFKLADLYTKQGLIIDSKQIYLDLADKYKGKNDYVKSKYKGKNDYVKSLDMYKKILEFDRNNIKMRLLLADSYIKQNMVQNATSEYLTASEIMINKKDFKRAENLLSDIFKKLKDYKILEKLVYCYKAQGNDQKAINLLRGIGSDLFKHIELLKILGELLFENNLMNEAEKVYKKITEINPEETEIIMKLGKVYLQREEYDKTYNLFLPLVEKNIKDNKYEEGASLLRFIIASDNSYLPALLKLSAIFKASGKKNNLIALYESLIPIYEENGMGEELKGVLRELIKLSDSPFTYEEQLTALEGKGVEVEEEINEEKRKDEKEKEFISFNLRVVEDAIKISDYKKAIEVLIRTKNAFPNNIETRLKLFDV
jgi:tetratricopeptide (TPR) repeat protein